MNDPRKPRAAGPLSEVGHFHGIPYTRPSRKGTVMFLGCGGLLWAFGLLMMLLLSFWPKDTPPPKYSVGVLTNEAAPPPAKLFPGRPLARPDDYEGVVEQRIVTPGYDMVLRRVRTRDGGPPTASNPMILDVALYATTNRNIHGGFNMFHVVDQEGRVIEVNSPTGPLRPKETSMIGSFLNYPEQQGSDVDAEGSLSFTATSNEPQDYYLVYDPMADVSVSVRSSPTPARVPTPRTVVKFRL